MSKRLKAHRRRQGMLLGAKLGFSGGSDLNAQFAFNGGLALNQGGGASAYASHPAPSGFHWEFVTENGARVTENAVPVVDLVGN